MAEQCGMQEVSHYLRKAKLAWPSFVGSRKTKQVDTRSFMK